MCSKTSVSWNIVVRPRLPPIAQHMFFLNSSLYLGCIQVTFCLLIASAGRQPRMLYNLRHRKEFWNQFKNCRRADDSSHAEHQWWQCILTRGWTQYPSVLCLHQREGERIAKSIIPFCMLQMSSCSKNHNKVYISESIFSEHKGWS